MAAGSRRWCLRSRGGLRLARFNADHGRSEQARRSRRTILPAFPRRAAPITVLLPIYLAFLGLPKLPSILTALYTLLIAFLMVSRLPVFSGKTVRMRVPPELVLPVFVSVIFFIALLIGYPWHILSAGSVLFLASLPMGWKSYRDQARKPRCGDSRAGGRSPAPRKSPPPSFAPSRAGSLRGRAAGAAALKRDGRVVAK